MTQKGATVRSLEKNQKPPKHEGQLVFTGWCSGRPAAPLRPQGAGRSTCTAAAPCWGLAEGERPGEAKPGRALEDLSPASSRDFVRRKPRGFAGGVGARSEGQGKGVDALAAKDKSCMLVDV